MKVRPGIILATILLCFAPCVKAQSTEEMVSRCQELIQAKIIGDQVAVPQDFDSGVCWGSFKTIETVIHVWSPVPQNGPMFGVCTPDGTTVSQTIKIFSDYAARHPEKLNQNYFFVAIAALKEAFPCKRVAP